MFLRLAYWEKISHPYRAYDDESMAQQYVEFKTQLKPEKNLFSFVLCF